MTNKELVQKAIVFENLSNEEWDALQEHLTKVSGSLFTALQTLVVNQSKLELVSNYLDYFGDRLEEPLPDEKYEFQTV